MNPEAIEKAREFKEQLEEKKTGLFLVEDHPSTATVWLDCRHEGRPKLYGYRNNQQVVGLKHTRPIKQVLAVSRAEENSQLTEHSSDDSDEEEH